MKRFLKFSLIVLVVLGGNSCDLNDDDDYYGNNYWTGFGFVHFEDDAGTSYYFTLDDSTELYPVNAYSLNSIEDSDRVLVNFTVVSEKNKGGEDGQYYVRLISVDKLLYKGILDITPSIEDSIGNDPVHVDHIWKSGKLLTLRLKFYGNTKTHYINLVKDPGELTAEDQPVHLELRHNDNDDQRYYEMLAYVTFDLSAIRIAGQDSVSYTINGVDYDGSDFTYKGVYHY